MGFSIAWRDNLNAEIAQGFVFAPAFYSLGILAFFGMSEEPSAVHIGLCVMIALFTCLLVKRASYALRPVIWIAALVTLGFSVAGLRSYSLAAPVLEWRTYGPVEGRVIGVDRSASGALRVTLDEVRLGLRDVQQTPRKIRISLYGSDSEGVPRAGSRVMTTAHLSPPSGPAEPYGFDFQRHAWFTQIGGVGYTRVPVLLAAEPSDGFSFFALRLSLSKRIQSHLSGQTGAFAAALMTGDRSGLSQDTLTNLRHSNLAHLLAISGLHMGLLVGFVFASLRILMAAIPVLAIYSGVKKVAALGGLIAAAGYLGLSGGSVATERAFVMAAVALGAVFLERRAISLRAVAVAALIILSRRPEAILGPGFQMSFAATTALVVVFNAISARNAGKPPSKPIRRLISGTVISSAVAGLATLPFAAAHFNTISHFGLIANLVSVPLMGLLIIPLAVVAVCLMPLQLDALPLHLLGIGLDWILSVAETVSHWPGAISKVPTPPNWAVFSLSIGLLCLALMASKLRFAGLIGVAVALLGWSALKRPDVLISDTGGLIGVLTEQGRALNKTKGAGFVAGVWLENDGDSAPQSVAGARWGGAAKSMTIGKRAIHAATGKRGLHAFEGCDPNDIAVFSEDFEAIVPCEVFDKRRLRKTGSVALFLTETGDLETITAREVAGRRYWNDPQLRKKRLKHQ
ncbi:ComEC/Rec2 family competence protein [Planktotalea sp.]|uniref:ComEC/Rec2 family competence protein n=1 Tax=Planktotalea sp. TaxID=2029877 RepID=UPI003D6C4854